MNYTLEIWLYDPNDREFKTIQRTVTCATDDPWELGANIADVLKSLKGKEIHTVLTVKVK